MRSSLRQAWYALALVVVATAATAHVRLVNPSNGQPLRWGRPSLVTIVFNAAGSDDLPPGAHLPALRNALAAWNDIEGTSALITEVATSTAMARTDWAADDIHLVLFDEQDDSGYFPSGSSTVAITPIWFGGNGVIVDADILFNGEGHQFTTSGQSGRFDVQDVAAHEIGHLLGLDHSGWAGATMFPYVDPQVLLHRSVSDDEVHGLRAAYPAGTSSTLAGFIWRASNHSAVSGAHVVARDAEGRTVASALTNGLGAFELRGLAAGDYQLHATPFEGPVTVDNLGAGHSVQTNFESTVLGTWSLVAGEQRQLGQLFVESDVPLLLGRPWDEYPLRAIAGQTRSFIVRGSGLLAGSTLSAADMRLGVFVNSWQSTLVTFQVTTPVDAEPGHVDLMVTDIGGQRSILVGALEITPRDPSVVAIAPTVGEVAGGTRLTLSGSRFRAGSRVVIGPEVYVDGQSGTQVVDEGTIVLTTRPTTGGTYDVVIIDPTGVEGRLTAALEIASIPELESVFPPSGSASGGTELALRGRNFDPGCTVSIDGVFLAGVVRVDSTLLRLTTQAHAAGGPYTLEVTNPQGATAQSAYAFVPAADPVLTTIDPPAGPASGGEVVVLHGANFDPASSVVFGADPVTGLGGTPAVTVTWIDGATLHVVTPRHPSGAHSVLVRSSGTGQAALRSAAFTFTSSGGGGGGCAGTTLERSSTPGEHLALGGWFALVALIVHLRRRRPATV